MARVRLFAAVLSILSLMVMVMALATGAGAATASALFAAAACLAIVAPFDARAPRQRLCVVVACFVHVVAIVAALTLVRGEPDLLWPMALLAMLVAMLLMGVGLTLGALATSGRRRMPQSNRYYDNG